MRIAQVIVDVSAMQTDQPFSYEIPPQMDITVGMRVEVPFGNGDRHVQGFVLDILEMAPEHELKKVFRVLDLEPVLNPELLQLADYMKDQTYAFKITCLQTMLPSVMKADYQKKIIPLILDETTQPYFEGEVLLWEDAQEKGFIPALMKLRAAGKVEIQYEVKTKNKVKTERHIKKNMTNDALRDVTVHKGAKKQAQLLTFLLELKEEKLIPVKEMKAAGFSLAVLNQGAEKGWLVYEEVEQYRDPFAAEEFLQTEALALNEEQQLAVEKATAALQAGRHEVFLLEGVTGSGKTEVYLQVIAEVLAKEQTAIMLVPEISLTPQVVQRFKGRFGDDVAVLHSGLSQGEKYDEWRKIERKEAKVVVGARSAIFAPLENIGAIIIDEEHEASYKQDETPRYHARDLAIWRGQYHHCPVILGSATPSLESRARAQKNVYTMLHLTKRAVSAATLPTVEILDMRNEIQNGKFGSFSRTLEEKLKQRLATKEQSVLLLNRRGYSSFVMCRDCGYVLQCPNCDISLTLHMDTHSMRCHYCGHEERIPRRCPECGKDKIRYYGTGTQKVEEELKEILPEARILRMDVDTTRRKGAHAKILKTFGDEKADILLGTQMIAKGLDFPNVTLVGVLNADTALNLPDFRSSERTFQLLTQVSGRAGRGHKPGEVVIQTFNPQHYAIQLAKQQDYEAFYQKEMQMRHRGSYPPYYFTVKLTASHIEEVAAAKKIHQIAEKLKTRLSPQALLLGPTPSAVLRVKNRYYYQVVIKYKHEPQLQGILKEILNESQQDARKGLLLSIDNEPMHFI